MRWRTRFGMLGGWVLAACLWGCKGSEPAKNADADVGDRLQQDAEVADAPIVAVPLKVDLLLVIEGRASTCRWRNQFTQGLQSFVADLRQGLAADLNAAVITMDVENWDQRGQFNVGFAVQNPLPCAERVMLECQYDFQCQDDPHNLGERWLCESATGGYGHVLNLNGSVNSNCRFQCDTTQDCLDAFVSEDTSAAQADRWACLMRGAQTSEYGCVQEPDTADCPADLPAVVAFPPSLSAAQVADLIASPTEGLTQTYVAGLSATLGSCADHVYDCQDCTRAAAAPSCRTDAHCDGHEGKTCAGIAADDTTGRTLCAQQCAAAQAARQLRCISSVGATQSTEGNMKAGLKATWLALDPEGENAQQLCLAKPAPELESDPERKAAGEALLGECFQCQDPEGFGVAVADCTGGHNDTCDALNPACRRFLREDAYLVLVFLTDEDDCSVDEDKIVLAEDAPICSLLGSSDQDPERLSLDVILKSVGWNYGPQYRMPMAPLTKYAERFHRLPPDPTHLLMAVIGGDASICFDQEPQAAEKFADRFAEMYWCTAYQPEAGTACWAEYQCYRRQVDPALAEQAAACIAEQGDAAALECYQQAITPELQPEVDQCIAEYRADPEVQRLFAEQPEVADNLGREVCQAGQPLDEAQREVYRQRFFYAKADPESPVSVSSYICQDGRGKSNHANRLQQFVHNLGPNGFFHNICGAEGLDIRLGPLGQDLMARIRSLAAGQTRR